MIPILSYCTYSNTIRQLPQNYLLAAFNGNVWICEPDLAADKELATKVFLELFNYESKYQKDGLTLLSNLTKN